MDLELIRKAQAFAIEAHGVQKRKYTGEPYWHHCQDVATTLIRYSARTEVVVAGWLHDTLEDTTVSIRSLVDHFGPEVADLVLQVTDVSRKEHGNRAARKRLDRQYLAGASGEGQMIKCADTISNTPSIVKNDPGFARVYIPEKVALINELRNVRAMCFPIWNEAFRAICAADIELRMA